MNQEVIIKTVVIKRIGEKQHFQLSIPFDAKTVIGFEYGATEKNGIPLPSILEAGPDDFSLLFFPNKTIGKLVLGATGCAGTFYQGDLTEDKNLRFGERVAPILWQPELWTHGRKRHELEFSVNENSTISGFFEDSWGVGEYESLSYKLNLYLWIEKCAL